MEIELTTLNDKIRKLLAFLDDMTIRVVDHGLAVSQVTASQQGLKSSESHHGASPDNGAKPYSFKLEKTDDGKMIIPSTVFGYESIKNYLLTIKFTESEELSKLMAVLKSWQEKNAQEKEDGKLLAYEAYLEVLGMISNGKMLNGEQKTPRNVAQQEIMSGCMNHYACTLETSTYMNPLFEEYDELKRASIPLRPRVKHAEHNPFSFTFSRNPLHFGLQIMGIQVAIFLQIELVHGVIQLLAGPGHIFPLIAQLPAIGIIAIATGIVAIGCVSMIGQYKAQPHKQAQPCLSLEMDFPSPSMKIEIPDDQFLFESKALPTKEVLTHSYSMQKPEKLIVELPVITFDNKYSIN